MSVPRTVRGLLAACLLAAAAAAGAQQAAALGPLADALARVPGAAPDEADALLARIDAQWDPRAVPMAMDVIHVSRSLLAALRLFRILEQHTGQGLGSDHGAWWQWILYHTEHAGTVHELGTSGFLYRSNKLMYDRATQSLWSTLRGEPVIGPLVGQGIRLARGSVVTTTWGEWRRRHPHTSVLSIDTGHTRDYAEGAAYRDYFATDALMF